MMYRSFLTTIFLVLSVFFDLNAQQPEEVYSFARIYKDHSWYVEQARLWWNEIEKDSTNAEAWYNYFKANRMAKATFRKPADWGNKQWLEESEYLMKSEDIIKRMEENVPNSFATNYVKWYNMGTYPPNFKYLQKAYAIDSNRPEVFDGFVSYYETQLQPEKRKEYNIKWFETNYFSPGFMAYNFNVLQSVEENAILLTHGDNDTFPAWLLQDAQNVRPDVKVLNVNLLQIDDYRNAVFEKLGIPSFDLEKSGENYMQIMQALVKHIFVNAPEKYPVYVGLTLSDKFYSDFEDNLYLTGLAMKYSEKRMDNIAILRQNFQEKYALDYLRASFVHDVSQHLVNHTNMNYLPALIKLYEHYKLSGEEHKAKEMKHLGALILTAVGKKAETENIFD